MGVALSTSRFFLLFFGVLTVCHGGPALVAPVVIHIDATVDPTLQSIEGELYLSDDHTEPTVDPHTKLPLPKDDRTHFRTFRGRAEQGKIGDPSHHSATRSVLHHIATAFR